jgi:hypothetical protein
MKDAINFETQFADGTEINSYLATAYAEGFCEGDGASPMDQLRAWAYLIKTGTCWQLQGWFGRTAEQLINSGIISPQGVIKWSLYEMLIDAE